MPRDLELPLLRDHHSHVSLYAALEGRPSILGVAKAEALRLLESLPKDRLSLVTGWSNAKADFAPEELARLPPVVIANSSLHGLRLSAAAREALRGSDPELVENHEDSLWCDRHVAALLSLYGRLCPLTPQKLDGYLARLAGLGVGTAEDMLVLDPELMRLRGIPCWADPGMWESFGSSAREAVTGLKIFLDGALAVRSAALCEPYQEGGLGVLLHTDEELQEKLAGLAGLGKPVAIHALGGRAVGQALGVLSRLGGRFPLVRLEHAQFIDEKQARQARDLGVVLSMQPNFSADSRDYADRLSPAQRAANNPFRMLIDRAGFRPGQDLLFGSDGMPHGAAAAWQWGLFPDQEGQRLTSAELEQGYGPAAGKGTIRLGIDPGRRRVELLV